jgi:PIN domain nuclease of toxin-antitoxin system
VRLRLDGHALLWWLSDSRRVGARARACIADPRHVLHVGLATLWEIAIEVGPGRLDLPPNPASWLPRELAANRIAVRPVTLGHALAVEHLPPHHRDPFDRLLIVQARAEGPTPVTSDASIARYDVPILAAEA